MTHKNPRTRALRNTKIKMNLLGIALGVFVALIIGVILYVLNLQHKWD